MVLSDARRMREADRAAIAGGIASTVLMETAARALAGRLDARMRAPAEAEAAR